MSDLMLSAPTHPGELLKEAILPGLGITQAELAQALELSRKTVNEILAGKSSVTAPTAVKLGALLKNSPEFWMNMQANFDLWKAKEAIEPAVLQDLAIYHQHLMDHR